MINCSEPYCGFLKKVWIQSKVPSCRARLALLGLLPPPNPMQGLFWKVPCRPLQETGNPSVRGEVISGKLLRWK